MLETEANRIADRVRREGTGSLTDEQLWAEHRAELFDALLPVLTQVAQYGVQSGRSALGRSSIGVDWELLDQRAADWARQYTYDLVSGITDTTRDKLQETLSTWIENPAPLDDLARSITDLRGGDGAVLFGPARAEMIASTEATRAVAESRSQAFEAAGVAPAAFLPPGHPRCRCYVQPFELPSGERVMVWYTGQDEMVCRSPIKTPWGIVEGCRAMHKVVVSEGRYLGMPLNQASQAAVGSGRA